MADDVRETLSAGFRAGKHHRFPRVQLGASRGARCSWKNQNRAPRYFFDRVRRGELTPEEAEHEAQKKEIGPLATAPIPSSSIRMKCLGGHCQWRCHGFRGEIRREFASIAQNIVRLVLCGPRAHGTFQPVTRPSSRASMGMNSGNWAAPR
jgi:hypothetical protein